MDRAVHLRCFVLCFLLPRRKDTETIDIALVSPVAAFTCTVWDHAITFNDELQYIWRRPTWDWSVLLFLLNRYGNEAALLVAFIFGNVLWSTQDTTVRPCLHCLDGEG